MSELSLSEKIKKDFDKFCCNYDDFCNGCPYLSSTMCEIDFTLDYVRTKVRADVIDSCKTVVMETIDNELLVDTLLMRLDKLHEKNDG